MSSCNDNSTTPSSVSTVANSQSSSNTVNNGTSRPPSAPVNTAGKPPSITTAQCRSNVLAGIYHPARLQVMNACETVSGTVDKVIHEADKDYHIRLKLDSQYANLINAKNTSQQYGDLVVEIIPMDAGKVPVPAVGQHISVTGAYVKDNDHGWMEIHPAWFINGQGSASYTQADANASVTSGIEGNGDEEGSSAPSAPSTPTLTPFPPKTTSTGIQIISSNLNVSHGNVASITVKTTPGATGYIEVDYSSGASKAAGLGPKTADGSGKITWSWTVGTRTTPGSWPVIITVDGQSVRTTVNVQ
jgi:hypothetical protein